MLGNSMGRALTAGSFNDVFKQLVVKQTLQRMGAPSGDSAPFTFFYPTADGRQFPLNEQHLTSSSPFELGFSTLNSAVKDLKHTHLLSRSRRQLENYTRLVRRMDRRWTRHSGPAISAPEVDDGPAFLPQDFVEAASPSSKQNYFPSVTDIAEVFLGPQDHMILGTGLQPDAADEFRNYYYPDPSDPHSQRLESGRRKPQVEVRPELLLESDVAALIPKTADGLVYFDSGSKPGHYRLRYHGDILMETYKRWPNATYLLCYDIEDSRPMELFMRAARTGSRRILNAEAYTNPFPSVNPSDPHATGLAGAGCCIVNPPEGLQQDLLGTISLMEEIFAPKRGKGAPHPSMFLPHSRVNWFGGATEKVVDRAHDRPSWGRLAHRGSEWTEEAATQYARIDAFTVANEFALEHNDIDLTTIPDSAFDPSTNHIAQQNSHLSRDRIIELMNEDAVEQAMFEDQDMWLRRHFRSSNMST